MLSSHSGFEVKIDAFLKCFSNMKEENISHLFFLKCISAG